MANTKKTTEPKPKPRSFGKAYFGSQLYHDCTYKGKGTATEESHDGSLTGALECTFTRRLSDTAKRLLIENPDCDLLKLLID